MLRPSGGLRWHMRALRYRECHRPFREQVASFLASWEPDTDDLVLVGPSAGWFLPVAFLTRFSRLLMIELDTSARFFFHCLHGRQLGRAGVSTRWLMEDFVIRLPEVLAARPKAAVLFCNVLGQLGLERADYHGELTALKERLVGRRWASFHDRFSATGQSARFREAAIFSATRSMDAAMLSDLGCSGEWIDHGTEAVFPDGTRRQIAAWSITTSRLHFVEMGSVS
ncbi:MAG: hypothetical protein EBZ91_02425 [Gammaproteobacteria bacterium]|nr:hypothetical protein [Gammaproteobacteria bacterium]